MGHAGEMFSAGAGSGIAVTDPEVSESAFCAEKWLTKRFAKNIMFSMSENGKITGCREISTEQRGGRIIRRGTEGLWH